MLSSEGIQKMAAIGIMPFFFILLSSLAASLFISHLYLRFYGVQGTGSTIHRAFPLLGVSITSIFVSLQFSIPLSLGLLGALSIVRFRAPIKDPQEIGFILLVIASSLACATFNMPFLGLIMVVSIIGLIILKYDKKIFRKMPDDGMLILKIPANLYGEGHGHFSKTVDGNLSGFKVDSILEQDNICTITYTFSNFSEQDAMKLRVGLKEISNNINMNVFYSNLVQ